MKSTTSNKTAISRTNGLTNTNLAGSTGMKKFKQTLTNAAYSSVTSTTIYAGNIASFFSDLSTTSKRYIRPTSFRIKFLPLGTSALPVSVQGYFYDPITGYHVPLTPITPLSVTNSTIIEGVVPVTSRAWYGVASTADFFALGVRNASGSSTVFCDITVFGDLSQDSLE